jgi:hypothetical protein
VAGDALWLCRLRFAIIADEDMPWSVPPNLVEFPNSKLTRFWFEIELELELKLELELLYEGLGTTGARDPRTRLDPDSSKATVASFTFFDAVSTSLFLSVDVKDDVDEAFSRCAWS